MQRLTEELSSSENISFQSGMVGGKEGGVEGGAEDIVVNPLWGNDDSKGGEIEMAATAGSGTSNAHSFRKASINSRLQFYPNRQERGMIHKLSYMKKQLTSGLAGGREEEGGEVRFSTDRFSMWSPDKDHKSKVGLTVRYYSFFWWVFLFWCVFSVIDRYSWELWRGCMSYYPQCVDSPVREGPVAIFDHFARISGRVVMVATSALFLTQSRCFMNWLMENAPRWMDVGDILDANNRLHWWIGYIFCGLPTVIHVWSVFVPFFFGYKIRFLEYFDRNDDPDQPGFINTINTEQCRGADFSGGGKGASTTDIPTECLEIALAGDDQYRLVMMTLLFLFLFPYSLSKNARGRSWSAAQYLHIAAALHYAIDILRKDSHPHSHVFNSPFVFMWIVDKILGKWFYRTGGCRVVNKVNIENDYMLLFLKMDEREKMPSKQIGDIYWFSMDGDGGELAHAFTCWTNNRAQPYEFPSDAHRRMSYTGHKFQMQVQNRNSIYISRRVTAANRGEALEAAQNSALARESNLTQAALEPSQTPEEMERQPTPKEQRGGGGGGGGVKCIVCETAALTVLFQPCGHVVCCASCAAEQSSCPKCQEDIDTSIPIALKQEEGGAAALDRSDWDVCVLASIHHPKEGNCTRRRTWTERVVKSGEKQLPLTFYGPYRSGYGILQVTNAMPPLVLVGTGAGAAYLLDFHQHVIAHNLQLAHPVRIYFSTKSLGFFQYVTDVLCQSHIRNLHVDAHLTSMSGKNIHYTRAEGDSAARDLAVGRMSLEEIIGSAPGNTEVYFCGSGMLNTDCERLCKLRGLLFNGGHVFAS